MSEQPEPLDPLTFGATQPCFGCGPNHPIGFHLRFERTADSVLTRFVPTESFQGPPGVMHGGLVMTLADELAAWTIIGLRERFGFTAAADVRFVQPVRIGAEVSGAGRITRGDSRVIKVSVTLAQHGATAFRGDFSFVLMDEQGAARLLGGPVAEAWKRFCR